MIFTALLAQTGTAAPTVIVHDNQFSNPMALSRACLGDYRFTSPGAFPENKWWAPDINRWSGELGEWISGTFYRVDDDTLKLLVLDNASNPVDLHNAGVAIEIRSYQPTKE